MIGVFLAGSAFQPLGESSQLFSQLEDRYSVAKGLAICVNERTHMQL